MPILTQMEFAERDFEIAEQMARRLGFKQTAYTTSSALWGLFCLPDRPTQKKGCIIKTKELGMMYVQDIEDMLMHDLAGHGHEANKWIESQWMGKQVRQNGGESHLVGRTGEVTETMWDEKGALHCMVEFPGTWEGVGDQTNEWFWCPVSLLEKVE